MAAAVGSLRIERTLSPARRPALAVASRSSVPKYAGQVMTTSVIFSSPPRASSASPTTLRRMNELMSSGLKAWPSYSKTNWGSPMCCLTRETTRCGSTLAASLAVLPTMMLSPSNRTTEGVIRSLSWFGTITGLPCSST